MYEPLRRRALALLKVPPEPHPPMGDPASLRVFRAGRKYFRLRVATWAAAQLLALAGILFWAAILIDVEIMARARQPVAVARPAAIAATPAGVDKPNPQANTPADPNQRFEDWKNSLTNRINAAATAAGSGNKHTKNHRHINGWAGFKQGLLEIALILPAWAFPLLWGLKIFSFLAYLLQIPVTYAVRRLDYEMRWYMVTDRSLRLRHGVWKVSESTMSFANIQQVTVSQGPIQRLLGLANVKVQSAGGGSGESEQEEHDMHTGHFEAVDNASEIRDLILERLRRYRATGLGDPDDHREPATTPAVASSAAANATPEAVAAARELLAEARALRSAVTSASGR